MNPRWKAPAEEADVFYAQATRGRLHDDWVAHLRNMLISQVTIDPVVKGGLALGSPIFPSGCEGNLGVALESLQGRRDLT